jgi:nephrocystin-3
MNTQDTRSVRVFLSSTFRDFAEERDLLVRKVFPELRRKCRERQVELVDVDLRWGITEKEAQQGKVLPICLAEIDRSRPWFMGFIGERYGWVPQKEKYDLSLLLEQPWLEEHRGGKSVTELEILHGVLNNPAMEGRAFFYFRDSKWSRKKGGAYLCEGTEEKAKLEALKERIRNSGFPVVENYPSPEALAERVREDLWKLIDEAYPESEVPDALTRERMAHEAYGATRRRLYLGGEAYFKALDEAMKAKVFRPVLITGQSGGGKSALVANWVAQWNRKHPKTAVIVHHLSSGADAADPVRLAVRLMREISRLTGDEFKPESDPEKLLEQLPQWLALASAWAQRSKQELLIVLDGLDKVSDRKHLRWFPGFLPPKVKLVVSCLHGEILEAAKGRLGWQELKVKPFIKVEQRNFIGEYLGRYRKALTARQMRTLQGHPLSGNPLFLLTVLEELRVFGVHEELEQRMHALLSPLPGNGDGEAPTVDDVFEHVLGRIEEDLGKKAVQQAMEAIWASRAGLYQDELLAIAKLAPAKWAAIQNALDESIYESSGKISFGHDYLRKAVEDRYRLTGKRKLKLHRRLAEWFANREIDERVANELPWQWRQAEAREQLVNCLLTREVFDYSYGKDKYELLGYWLWTGANIEAAHKRVWNLLQQGLDEEALAKFTLRLGRFINTAGFFGDFTERLFRLAIEGCEKTLGEEHPDTLFSVTEMSEFLGGKGYFKSAQMLYARALKAYVKKLSEEINSDNNEIEILWDAMICLSKSASLNKLMGDRAEAESLYKLALEIAGDLDFQNDLVFEHFVLSNMCNLGAVLMESGDYNGANIMLHRALKGLTKIVGALHPDTLRCHLNIGILHNEKGDSERALASVRLALEGLEVAMGPKHPDTLRSAKALAIIINKKDGPSEAATLLQRWHDLSDNCADALRYNLACYECLSGNAEQAKSLLAKHLSLHPEKKDQALGDEDFSRIREWIAASNIPTKPNMSNKPMKNTSWISGVRANLIENPPSGWIVLDRIKGAGIQMLPDEQAYLIRNRSGKDLELVGNYRLVFEFFRLNRSGNLKLSVRVAGIEGQPLFHEFWAIARALGCPRPKVTKKENTQSVAVWPENEERLSFGSTDHTGMAEWVRKFLVNPPADFVLFVAASRNLISAG